MQGHIFFISRCVAELFSRWVVCCSLATMRFSSRTFTLNSDLISCWDCFARLELLPLSALWTSSARRHVIQVLISAVYFSDPGSASTALKAMNGKEIDGDTLEISLLVPHVSFVRSIHHSNWLSSQK